MIMMKRTVYCMFINFVLFCKKSYLVKMKIKNTRRKRTVTPVLPYLEIT